MPRAALLMMVLALSGCLRPHAPRSSRRVTWIGLRTLRRRPRLVGQTRRGVPVFEACSVRLVLPDDAHHFARLISCARCGSDGPGATVLRRSDLAHPPHAVICDDCVGSAASQVFGSTGRDDAVPESGGTENGEGQGPPPRNGSVPHSADAGRPAILLTDDVRLAELELHMEQRIRSPRIVDTRAEFMTPEAANTSRMRVLEERLDRLQAFLDGETYSRRLESIECQMQEAVGRLSEMVELHTQQSRDALVKLTEVQAGFDCGLGELRSEIATIREADEELAAARRLEAVEQRVEHTLSGLTEVTEAQRSALVGDGWQFSLGRRSAETAAKLAAVSSVAVEMIRERGELRAQLARLERAGEAATSVAEEASSQASALAPLDSDVKALKEQLSAQDEALLALRKAVEGLRRKSPTPTTAAKRAAKKPKA